MPRTVEIIVTGQLQEHNFRGTAKSEAKKNHITGTVKNINQSTILIEASGEPDDVDAFINWCSKGPANGAVSGITVKDCAQKKFSGFEVLRNRKA